MIVDALRAVGARVKPTHTVGNGFPDLVIAFRGRTVLMELKVAGEGLNKEQQQFFEQWNGGELFVVHSPQEALEALLGKKVMA